MSTTNNTVVLSKDKTELEVQVSHRPVVDSLAYKMLAEAGLTEANTTLAQYLVACDAALSFLANLADIEGAA